ncbi:cytochrome c4 [Chryseolinea lacunae]|uniref:C-type cytochrome n=1 Tax=Chryseolinea lacunae TaxID=2801331 RepID=A0ABS1KPS1_9BACT|nr:c-type cytochrome [Chryseolinea lacunae]MBL0740286.1 c-type cytochrome [Chryseolinea lacunae]
MLKKILKVTGIVLGVIVVIIAGYYTKVYISTERRMHKKYEIALEALPLSRDSAVLARGAHLVRTKACTECHGQDLGGKVFVDDPALGFLIASNLTNGKGGRPADFGADDWTLALKHGLRRDRTPLIFMPAHEFAVMSEQDLSAIASFCEQLPDVDREFEPSSLGPLARVLADLDKLPLLPAEMIDHSKKLVKEVKAEISADYGKYLSTSCQGCHRENMKGGEPVAPGFPEVADISSSGHPGKWTDEQFINTLRTGTTPEGKTLKPDEMPWTMTKEFSDLELKALHLYLKSI